MFQFSTGLGSGIEDEEVYGNTHDWTTGDAGGLILAVSANERFFARASVEISQIGSRGSLDMYLVWLNREGHIDRMTCIGGPSVDHAVKLRALPDGSLLVVGKADAGFPLTEGPAIPANAPRTPVCFRLSPDGTQLLEARVLPLPVRSIASVDFDDDDRIYVAGHAQSDEAPPTAAAGFQPKPAGELDVFVARISDVGRRLDYFSYYGGSADDYQPIVTSAPGGRAFLKLKSESADIRLVRPLMRLPGPKASPTVLAAISSDGSELEFATPVVGRHSNLYRMVAGMDGAAVLAGASRTENPQARPAQQREGLDRPLLIRVAGDGSSIHQFGFPGGPLAEGRVDDLNIDHYGRLWMSGWLETGGLPGAIKMMHDSPAAFVARMDSGVGTIQESYQIPFGNRLLTTAGGFFVLGSVGNLEWPERFRQPLYRPMSGADPSPSLARITGSDSVTFETTRIQLSRKRLNFGSQWRYGPEPYREKTFTITNTGKAPADGWIMAPASYSPVFELPGGSRAYSLMPGETERITVRFWKDGGPRIQIGALSITSNDPRHSAFQVRLRGEITNRPPR